MLLQQTCFLLSCLKNEFSWLSPHLELAWINQGRCRSVSSAISTVPEGNALIPFGFLNSSSKEIILKVCEGNTNSF